MSIVRNSFDRGRAWRLALRDRVADRLDRLRAERDAYALFAARLDETLCRLRRSPLPLPIDGNATPRLSNPAAHAFAVRGHDATKRRSLRDAASAVVADARSGDPLTLEKLCRWHATHVGAATDHAGKWKETENFFTRLDGNLDTNMVSAASVDEAMRR